MTDDASTANARDADISTGRFLGNTAAVGLSTGSKAASYFIVSLVLTRTLGTASLGVFTVALSSALLALRVAELGVGAIVVRDTARQPDRGPALLGSGLLLRLPGLVLMAGTVAVIVRVVGYEADEKALMWLLAAYVALESLSRLFFSNSHGRMRMEEEAWVTLPASLIIAIGSVSVLVANGGLVSVGIVFVVGGAVQLSGALVVVTRRAPGWHRRARWSAAGDILRQSWPIGLAGLAAVVYYRIDTLMLAALAGNTATGEYSMAYNLLYGPNLLIWALMASVFPILSEGAGATNPLLHRHYRKLTAAAVTIGAGFLVVIPLASLILLVLYGTAPKDAVLSLQILLVAQLFTFVSAATSTTFNATDAQRSNLVIVVSGVILNIALNAVVIPRYAAPGAAATTLVTEAFVATVGIIVLFRRGLRPFFARPAVKERGLAPTLQVATPPDLSLATSEPKTQTPGVIIITSYPDEPTGPITGPQRVVRSLVEALHSVQFPIEVWSSPYRLPPRRQRVLADRGAVIRFANPLAIVAVALRHPAAALHIGTFSMFHVAPLIARRILGWIRPVGPIVYTAHGLLAVESQLGHRVVPLLTPLAERVLMKGSDRVVVLSAQMSEMLQTHYGIGPTRLEVIPPATPPEFSDNAGTLPDSRSESFFLYAGELRRVKGLDVLVGAVHELDRSHNTRSWSVVIAGDPQSTWQPPDGWDDLLESGRLRHVGSVSTDELNRLYDSAVALLLPSIYEPYGMVVLEAMAAGTPAIMSDRVGARDLVDDGATGWVIPNRDSMAFADAMAWVLDNPAQTVAMSGAIRESAERRTADSVAQRYIELYGRQHVD